MCSKKLKLFDQLKCRCGEMFCSQHLHAESHNCKFDYQTQNSIELSKSLISSKIRVTKIDII